MQWLWLIPLVPLALLFSAVMLKFYVLPNQLLDAAQEGNVAKVRAMLDLGVDINTQDGWGSTPMMYAAVNGNTEVVELLLERGDDVNDGNHKMGRIPIMWAAQGGYDDTVRLLLTKGARTDLTGINGETAMMLACEEEHPSTIEILKASGAAQ